MGTKKIVVLIDAPHHDGVGDRGRRAGGPRRRHLARVDPWRKQVSGHEGVVIREWCNDNDNGYRIGRRGPLPFGAVDAYRSANFEG